MNRYPLWKNLLVFGVSCCRRSSPCRTCSATTRRSKSRARTASPWTRRRSSRFGRRSWQGGVAYLSPRSRTMSALGARRGPRAPGARARRAGEGVSEPRRSADAGAAHAGLAQGHRPEADVARPRSARRRALPLPSGSRLGRRTVSRDLRVRPAHAVARGEIRNDVRIAGTRLAGRDHRAGATSTAPRRSSARSTRGDQLLQLGQLTSRLIDRSHARSTAARASRVRLTESAIRERQDFAIQQNTRDAAQPRQRARRRRGRRAAPGPRPHPRRAAGHPGSGDGEARARLDGDARVPPRRHGERCRTRRSAAAARRSARSCIMQRRRHADPAAARHHRVRRSARRRDVRVRERPARRERAARCGRRAARCSTRRSTTSASRWPCCSSRTGRRWSSATA